MNGTLPYPSHPKREHQISIFLSDKQLIEFYQRKSVGFLAFSKSEQKKEKRLKIKQKRFKPVKRFKQTHCRVSGLRNFFFPSSVRAFFEANLPPGGISEIQEIQYWKRSLWPGFRKPHPRSFQDGLGLFSSGGGECQEAAWKCPAWMQF